MDLMKILESPFKMLLSFLLGNAFALCQLYNHRMKCVERGFIYYLVPCLLHSHFYRFYNEIFQGV